MAYGFLCGRDYETQRHVRNNRSGFDLFKARRRAFPPARVKPSRTDLTIGIPAALHLFEDLPLWKTFFGRLGIRTVTSERYQDAVKDGRLLAGAELCAPMTASTPMSIPAGPVRSGVPSLLPGEEVAGEGAQAPALLLHSVRPKRGGWAG